MVVFIRKRLLIIVGSVLAFFALAAGGTALATLLAPPPETVIVLDAGHGGIDTGVIGIESRVKESDLNLLVTQSVKKLLETQKIKVILTRENERSLSPDGKRADMAKRKEIILQAAPDLVVSIHCNKFPDHTRRGAQVFFNAHSERSISLSNFIQSSLNPLNAEQIGREFSALKGDYYILSSHPYPSAIVECGFLSNVEDDRLLNSPEYREKLAFAIYTGILSYVLNAA
ncbi:MAG: N-acetylmuramoyl-L-alanine amidase [Clostridia bacterium]